MTAMPGTPAIQSAIPMPFFGTTPFAAPGLGVIGAAVMALLGLLSLQGRAPRGPDRGDDSAALQVGYGAVIASLSGIALLRDAVLGVAPGNPLVSLSIEVTALAGITGSADALPHNGAVITPSRSPGAQLDPKLQEECTREVVK